MGPLRLLVAASSSCLAVAACAGAALEEARPGPARTASAAAALPVEPPAASAATPAAAVAVDAAAGDAAIATPPAVALDAQAPATMGIIGVLSGDAGVIGAFDSDEVARMLESGARDGTQDLRSSVPGSEQVEGGLSREAVRRVVQARQPRIVGCYERALAKNPALSGRMVVRFEIDRSGAVQGVGLEVDGVGDADVGTCVRATFASMKFPAPSGGKPVTVRYPLTFRPADDGAPRDAGAAPASPGPRGTEPPRGR